MLITLREDIFAEKFFAEINFAILALNREIKFRRTCNYCPIAKINSGKLDFLKIIFETFSSVCVHIQDYCYI